MLFGFLAALPSVLPPSVRDSLPGFLPRTPVTLGLDLQGGSHVLLEVDSEDLRDQMAKQLIGDIRLTLRDKRIRYAGLGRSGDRISVQISDPAQMDEAYTALAALSQQVSIGIFGTGGQAPEFAVSRAGQTVTFTFTEAGLTAKIGRAIDQSLDIIDQRVNALGTTEPTIQRQGVDRMLVQVPGLQDPNRLKELLGKTAQLQFRLLCDSQPMGE